jgi:hypothetical protein
MRPAYELRPIVVHVVQRHYELGARERLRSAVGDGRKKNVFSKDKLGVSQGSSGIQVRKRGAHGPRPCTQPHQLAHFATPYMQCDTFHSSHGILQSLGYHNVRRQERMR